MTFFFFLFTPDAARPKKASSHMIALVAIALSAPAPLQPSRAEMRGRMHCVSTAVDLKSAWCDKACNDQGSGEVCPKACLCVRVPWPDAPKMVKNAKAILHRLGKGLRKLPPGRKHYAMKAAKATAAHAMKVVTFQQRSSSQCKSQVRAVCPTGGVPEENENSPSMP